MLCMGNDLEKSQATTDIAGPVLNKRNAMERVSHSGS